MQRHLSWVFFGIIIIFALAAYICLPGTTEIFGRTVGVVQGLDLQGGVRVLECAKPGTKPTSAQMDSARDVIELRVGGLAGLSAPQVAVVGSNCIDVELPGVKNKNEAIAVIGQTGNLIIGDSGVLSSSTNPIPPQPNQKVALTTNGVADASAKPPLVKVIVPGNAVVQGSAATAFTGTGSTPWSVTYQIQGAPSDAWCSYTTHHQGYSSPIVLDKKVVSDPTIQGAICGGNTQITGLTSSEATELKTLLNYGALPIALQSAGVQTVSATLGANAIHKAKLATAVGLILVMLFMLLYYRLPGLIADLALIVYACVVFALFKVIPVTLTLPGIAGFILSIGMAVDANVLIFERCKEELRAGKTLGAAIDSGFNRAWTSIRDSNISTIITTVILYWFGNHFGTTIITGFASTLFIGVVVSMFTAIIVTRTFLRLLVASGRFRSLALWGVSEEEVGAATGAPVGAQVV